MHPRMMIHGDLLLEFLLPDVDKDGSWLVEKQIVLCNAVTLEGLQQDVESLAEQYAASTMPDARAEDVTSPQKPPVKSRYLRYLASCSVSSALNAGSGQADRETRNILSQL